MLPQNKFIRIHRSFLIPIDKISSFTKKEIHQLDGKRVFPIGRQYQNEIDKILKKNK